MLDLLEHTSGLLIAIVGGVFTYFYNRRQHELVAQRDRESERLQLLGATEKMIPHLHGGSKEAALVALSKLAGSTQLIVSMAELYPGRAAAMACLDILDKQGPVRDLSLVARPLFYSLYSAAGEPGKPGELGIIDLLAERLHEEERSKIFDETDSQGRTAMMNAARYNRGGNIRRLARLGATLDTTDRGGESALHHAARYGNRNATIALIEMAEDKVAHDDWSPEQAKVFLEARNRRNLWTAAELAEYHGSRPENKNRSTEYDAVARRLRLARATLGD